MRLGRTQWLAAAGGAAFLLFLLGGLPARVAARWLLPPGVTVSDVEGTLWNGAIASVAAGPLRLGPLSWSLAPLPLLAGRVQAEVTAQIGSGEARGVASVAAGGRVSCSPCAYDGPAASLRGLAPALQNLEGNLKVEITALEIRDKWPTRALATIRLSGVPLHAPGMPPAAGAPSANFVVNVAADPVPEDGLIEAMIEDGGGPVQVTGRIALTPPGNYQVNARAKAKPDAPAQVINALATLGARGPDGSTDIGMSGSF